VVQVQTVNSVAIIDGEVHHEPVFGVSPKSNANENVKDEQHPQCLLMTGNHSAQEI
jgi:hypothetical protein